MAARTINWLKALFITGYKPTQADFADVFDSFAPVNLSSDIRSVKLTTTTAVTTVTFAADAIPAVAFSEGSIIMKMGKPDCTNNEGDVWCAITNLTASGFTLTTEIGVNFECSFIKIL